tara:strand:+ start:86 stop:1240 length:1155 start_codon:yes stop_codon:yes gene_type:complete
MNPAELYTQLATQTPKRDTPIVEPEDNFVLPELDEAQQKELGDYIQQAYSMYEGLPSAQKLVAEVAPGTGEAISAYEAKKFAGETKEAFEEGEFGEAALKGGLTILAGLGTIPVAGKGVQLVKAAAKRLPELLSPKNLNKILKENKKPVTDFNKEKLTDEIEESKEYLDLNFIPKGQEPKNITKGYKLFRQKDNELFPLFVDTKNSIPKNQWMKADKGYYFLDTKDIKRQPALTGDYQPIKSQADIDVLLSKGIKPTTTKKALEKSPFGTALAVKYRPGFHGDTFPSAKHLAQGGTGKGKDRVWAEVEFSNDKNYTDIVKQKGTNPETGKFSAKDADIDYVPEGGSYRYKTNPNMEGSWLIGGEMKINRVLSKDEVTKINKKRN